MTRQRKMAALIAPAALILLVGCGGSPSSIGSDSPRANRSTGSPSAVAYSACMRSHGVANYPDPDSSGGVPKENPEQLGVSTAQLQAAGSACSHLLPGGGGTGPTQAQVQQEWHGMLQFARCMRSHGVSSWPDPTPYPQYPDEPTFIMPASLHPTAQIVSRMRECQRLVPHNAVGGHIDNDSWQAVSGEMAPRS
jgi:hypothetical protein